MRSYKKNWAKSVQPFWHVLETNRRQIDKKSISMYILLVWVSVCLFVSNKRKNGWTDRIQNWCGLHVTPGKVYGWSNFQKNCLHQNSIFENPRNFLLNPRNLLFDLFKDVYKEKMFTIEMEDKRKALLKPIVYRWRTMMIIDRKWSCILSWSKRPLKCPFKYSVNPLKKINVYWRLRFIKRGSRTGIELGYPVQNLTFTLLLYTYLNFCL